MSYLSRNVPEISERKSRGLFPDSTSLPDVNLVDGLPSARHTEAVGGPMCLGQRLSGAEALGNKDFNKNASSSQVKVLFKF